MTRGYRCVADREAGNERSTQRMSGSPPECEVVPERAFGVSSLATAWFYECRCTFGFIGGGVIWTEGVRCRLSGVVGLRYWILMKSEDGGGAVVITIAAASGM